MIASIIPNTGGLTHRNIVLELRNYRADIYITPFKPYNERALYLLQFHTSLSIRTEHLVLVLATPCVTRNMARP